jgi:hypothetical protein
MEQPVMENRQTAARRHDGETTQESIMNGRKSPSRILASYLRQRLHHLLCCNSVIQTEIDGQLRDLCEKVDKGELDRTDPSIGKIVFHLQYVIGNTYRYTLLIGVCSFLEESMKAISRVLVRDYESKWNVKKRGRGNWLDKQVGLLSDSVGLDVTPIHTDLDGFRDLIALRNCIVHAWGKVAEAIDPGAVKSAASRLGVSEISRDGYLVLNDQAVPTAIWSAECIIDAILMAKLNVSIT